VVGVVAGTDVGVGVLAPGTGVAVFEVFVPVPLIIPLVDVGMGVPATDETAGVCVSPDHVVEPVCGERTILVPVMAALAVSDI